MFVELLKYMQVADERIIEVLSATTPSDRSIYLFSHILNAQHIWSARILERATDFGVEQLHAINEFADISKSNSERLWEVWESVPLERVVAYTTSRGDKFENTVADILFHVINHSTYHRAQIATDLRQTGIVPPVTDYIILKREGLL